MRGSAAALGAGLNDEAAGGQPPGARGGVLLQDGKGVRLGLRDGERARELVGLGLGEAGRSVRDPGRRVGGRRAAAGEVGLSGVVMEAGDGDAPDGCFDEWPLIGTPPGPEARGGAWWFRAMGSDGRPWTVGVHVPGLARPVDTTLEIVATWAFEAGGFSPDTGSFELHDASSALLVWIAEGGSLESVTPPPVDVLLEQGRTVYRDSDECGTWEGYDLEVVGDDGLVTPLPYGESADLGAITFWHGGFDSTTDTSDRCSDWFVAHVLVAAALL